tara:strand:- start:56 stop:289 length:234 start_codon:yes stop_codon:yes gene_type:complete
MLNDPNNNKRKNEMEEKTRQDIIKSMIKTYYLVERNMPERGDLTRQLDIEFKKIMTKDEWWEFYDSNQYQGIHWGEL